MLVLAATLLTLGLRGHDRAFTHPPLVGRTTAMAHPYHVARSRPVSLAIPAIGLRAPLTTLGLNPNRTVQVPTNFQEPGWYRLGPSPGQLGSAVILGHIDSYLGPAVFFQLGDLHVRDRVTVTLADGRTVRFAVIGIAMYLKSHFPDRLVYGPRPYGALQLVTCGGVFDSATGHYLSNLVVYTSLIGPAPRVDRVAGDVTGHRSASSSVASASSS
jgi:hypothetical protein